MLGHQDLDCTLISDSKNASLKDIKQKKYSFSSIRPKQAFCFFKAKIIGCGSTTQYVV